jgi:hypothetical protein
MRRFVPLFPPAFVGRGASGFWNPLASRLVDPTAMVVVAVSRAIRTEGFSRPDANVPL